MELINIEGWLSFVDLHGIGELTSDKIDQLEEYIERCNEAMESESEPLVEDAVYDRLVEILREVREESPLLREVWSKDSETVGSYNDLLERNPMMSILTVKSWESKDIEKFIDRLPDRELNYLASYKLNGHGIRVVYKNGYLVEATSRGRSTNGNIITTQLQWLLGDYNEKLKDISLIEIRGELVLKLDKLDEARKFTPTLKSAFSAVSSLIKPSATKEEVQLLDFITYKVIMSDYDFDSQESAFEFLETHGFEVTKYLLLEGVSKNEVLDTMKKSIELMEDGLEEYGYFCDGVVFEVSDGDVREELVGEGKYNNYNLALKVGYWSQELYKGYIKDIQWKTGKNKLNPVALVTENAESDLGVLTIQGNRVKNVPLYNPKNMLILEAYKGRTICFKYGGEAGVVPCLEDGTLLSDDYVKNMLTAEYEFEYE